MDNQIHRQECRHECKQECKEKKVSIPIIPPSEKILWSGGTRFGKNCIQYFTPGLVLNNCTITKIVLATNFSESSEIQTLKCSNELILEKFASDSFKTSELNIKIMEPTKITFELTGTILPEQSSITITFV